jgi:hypothetical protein
MHQEYAELFKTGQYGRFYIVSGMHARGRTFHIYILPEGEGGIYNGKDNRPLNENAVEVYGVTGGDPGWSETYGWLHHGKWEQDFAELVDAMKVDAAKEQALLEQKLADLKAAEARRIAELLRAY